MICKKGIINPFFQALGKKSTFFAFFDRRVKRGAAFFTILSFQPNIDFNKSKVSKVLRKKTFFVKNVFFAHILPSEAKNDPFFAIFASKGQNTAPIFSAKRVKSTKNFLGKV